MSDTADLAQEREEGFRAHALRRAGVASRVIEIPPPHYADVDQPPKRQEESE